MKVLLLFKNKIIQFYEGLKDFGVVAVKSAGLHAVCGCCESEPVCGGTAAGSCTGPGYTSY